ncbi:MAG: DUF4199 domain-containing protein [Chitinophagaceae bacterium]
METAVTSPGSKALVIALIMIVLNIVFYLLGVRGDSPLQYVMYGVLLIGVIISINMFGKQIHYNATFGNYFAHGFKVSAIVTIIMIAYIVVFLFVFPEYKEKMIAEVEKKMRVKGKVSNEEITQGMAMWRKGFIVITIAGTLLANLVFGVIASLIGAAMTKKDKNNYQQDISKIGS